MLADGRRLPGPRKKSLIDALEGLARGAPVQHDMLRRLRLAQTINRLHGGAVVSLWDLDDLDRATEDFFMAYALDYPRMQRRVAAAEQQRMTWLRAHPQYGQHGLLGRKN